MHNKQINHLHIQRCLIALIDVAHRADRVALLPPPSLLLHPDQPSLRWR